VGIDHVRAHVVVAKKFLNGPFIVFSFEQTGHGRNWQRIAEGTDQHKPIEADFRSEGVFGVWLVGTKGPDETSNVQEYSLKMSFWQKVFLPGTAQACPRPSGSLL
jgi:hypothetical protein